MGAEAAVENGGDNVSVNLETIPYGDQSWIEACKGSLCAPYKNLASQMTSGIMMERLCSHPWCDGILDVIDRLQAKDSPHWYRRT